MGVSYERGTPVDLNPLFKKSTHPEKVDMQAISATILVTCRVPRRLSPPGAKRREVLPLLCYGVATSRMLESCYLSHIREVLDLVYQRGATSRSTYGERYYLSPCGRPPRVLTALWQLVLFMLSDVPRWRALVVFAN